MVPPRSVVTGISARAGVSTIGATADSNPPVGGVHMGRMG